MAPKSEQEDCYSTMDNPFNDGKCDPLGRLWAGRSLSLWLKSFLVNLFSVLKFFWSTLMVWLMQFGKEASKLPINFTVYGQKKIIIILEHQVRIELEFWWNFANCYYRPKNPRRFSKLKRASQDANKFEQRNVKLSHYITVFLWFYKDSRIE